jgi:hypothetical protein
MQDVAKLDLMLKIMLLDGKRLTKSVYYMEERLEEMAMLPVDFSRRLQQFSKELTNAEAENEKVCWQNRITDWLSVCLFMHWLFCLVDCFLIVS